MNEPKLPFIWMSVLLFVLAVWFLIFGYGCTPHPYTVCGKTACTPGLSHEEAVRAAEVRAAWPDSGLYIDVKKAER